MASQRRKRHDDRRRGMALRRRKKPRATRYVNGKYGAHLDKAIYNATLDLEKEGLVTIEERGEKKADWLVTLTPKGRAQAASEREND